MEQDLRLITSRVEGLPEVTEVVVFPRRRRTVLGRRVGVLSIRRDGRVAPPGLCWRLLSRSGWRIQQPREEVGSGSGPNGRRPDGAFACCLCTTLGGFLNAIRALHYACRVVAGQAATAYFSR